MNQNQAYEAALSDHKQKQLMLIILDIFLFLFGAVLVFVGLREWRFLMSFVGVLTLLGAVYVSLEIGKMKEPAQPTPSPTAQAK